MAIFCTQCGAKNDDGAAFCEGCGASLRKPVTVAPPAAPAADPVKVNPSVRSKKAFYVGAAITGLLLLGGAGLYLALTPPAATSNTLLAAAKAGYNKTQTGQYKRELCLSNMNYATSNINVAENDQGTQTWLNTLVSAGLFSPPNMISSGGYFPQNLMQYVATPELAKWRDGSRLCLAKDVEIAEVIEIEKPQEELLGRLPKGGDSKVLTAKAQLVLQATETAPWLDKEEIRTAALEKMSGWEFKNAKLQKQIPDTFGLREGKWTTGPVYKAELQKQVVMNQRAVERDESARSAANQGASADLGALISKIFSFGGHPMMGTWRRGEDETVQWTFTADTCDIESILLNCKFEVDGNRVKVRMKDGAMSLNFIMRDKTTAILDQGMGKVVFKRVN